MAQEEIFLILPLLKAREAGTERETGRSWEYPSPLVWYHHIITVELNSPSDGFWSENHEKRHRNTLITPPG